MTQSKKTITLTELESSTYGNTQYKICIVVAEVSFFVGNPVGCSISENGFKRILLDIFYLNHFQLYCNLKLKQNHLYSKPKRILVGVPILFKKVMQHYNLNFSLQFFRKYFHNFAAL